MRDRLSTRNFTTPELEKMLAGAAKLEPARDQGR